MSNKVSASEALVNHFAERIRAGEFNPGDSLPSERELQKQLGISRFALREGLARMSALGLIRIQHGKGAFIAEGINPESLKQVFLPMRPERDQQRRQELFEARVLIEGELAALAATRHDEKQMAALHEILEATEGALDDPDEFSHLDLRFHQLIAEMAGNSYLLQMHTAIWDQVQPILDRHAEEREKRESILKKHRRITEAIASGSGSEAREVAVANLKAFVADYP